MFETLIVFSAIVAIILGPQYLKYRERGRLHETLRLAFERGQSPPPELMEMLQSRQPLPEAPMRLGDRSQRDLRRGVVWLAVGAGLLGVGLAFYGGLYNAGGAQETLGSFGALAAIPACIGLAFLGLWFFNRNSSGL